LLAPDEIDNSIYETLGDRWYTAFDDPVALLRAESRAKTPWVLDQLQRRLGPGPKALLDVGCGAGFLTNALAQAGHRVVGVDLSESSLEVARRFDATKSVVYEQGDAYALPFSDSSFDVVTSMDFLEHVEDPGRVVAEIARVLRPGGLFFFHTFHRNPIAGFVVIRVVEWLVKNTPKNMHVYRLFITPGELRAYCATAGLGVEELVGLRPLLMNLDILKNLLSGVVPESFGFTLTRSTLISYMGVATKAPSAA